MYYCVENFLKEGKEKCLVWNMVCKYVCLMYYLLDFVVWYRVFIFFCCGDFNYKISYVK